MVFQYLLPALALAGSALAQCGDGTDFTITSTSDTSKFTGCTSWNGNIIIDSAYSGALQIDYLQQISGDLKCTNASAITSLTATGLKSIGGQFRLEDVQNLGTVEMDFLTKVDSLVFIGLPNLYGLQFATGVSEANDVYISNTMLRDLKGIELTIVSTLNINNNMQLNTVNVNNMTNVTTALSFAANGQNLDVSLPNLVNAANITFRACNSVDIPSLEEVPGSVGFYSNSFDNITVANLTRIGSTLAIVGSPDLTEVSFPLLTLVNGGLIVANNTALKAIEGFPKLSQVAGAIDFYGTFDAADLPGLSVVKGAATIVTSSTNSTICNSFQQQGSSGKIGGQVRCLPNTADPTTNVTSSGNGTKSAASSSSAGVSMVVTGAVSIAAALFFL